MSSTIRVDTILDQAGSSVNPPSIPALDRQLAAAWVNFNGTGVVAINDSYNVTSITDNGTGNYTVNITNALGSANHAPIACSNGDEAIVQSPTTTDFVIVTSNSSGTAADASLVTAITFVN